MAQDATPLTERECPFNLTELTADQRIVWDWAFRTGYVQGHEAGWQAADDAAAGVFRRATAVVHAMADLPAVDEDERARIIVARDEARRRITKRGAEQVA